MVKKNKVGLICNLLIFTLIFTVSMLAVNGTDFYKAVLFSYSNEVPQDVFAIGGACTDFSCQKVNYNDGTVSFYSLDAVSGNCFTGLTYDQMNQCMQKYKINGNIVPSDGVIIKYSGNLNANSVFDVDFHTSNDSYPVDYYKEYNLPISSINQWQYNWNSFPFKLKFNKQNGGIAEIQKLDIINQNNPLKPVQISVPVKVSQDVCSALIVHTNIDKFLNQPSGYADYNANTQVTLSVYNDSDNSLLNQQSIMIPIKAETCAGLGAFNWTPNPNLKNQKVKFVVDTKVIDNQIINAQPDQASVTETIFPQNLADQCWAKSYDFELSNLPTTTLTPSIAQYTKGETLYAIAKNGAFQGNSLTPTNYVLTLKLNGTVIDSYINAIFKNTPASSVQDLHLDIINITNDVKNLDPGVYNVTLIVKAIGGTCSVNKEVEQSQQLVVLDFTKYHMVFNVADNNGNSINNADINLKLTQPDGYFVNPPVYDKTLTTGSNGVADFDDVIPGEYKYTIAANGFLPSKGDIYIGGDKTLDVKLSASNSLPIIKIPDKLSTYYKTPIVLDLKNYIYDANDDFDSLIINGQLLSGQAMAVWNKADGTLTFSATTPNDAEFKISVTDSYGGVSTKNVKVSFTNNNPPQILNFNATPDNGKTPLPTTFQISVTDKDNDPLTCTLDFGDGQNVTKDCSLMKNYFHTYNGINTYTATLKVTDGKTDATANKLIYVYQNANLPNLVINKFNVVSTNGNNLPTNLTVNWNVTNKNKNPIICSLNVNGQGSLVGCVGSKTIDNFAKAGLSNFTITATDMITKDKVNKTITKTFIAQNNIVVNKFSLLSTNNNFVPTNLTLSWNVTDTQNNIDCTLNVNGVNSSVNCIGSKILNNFNKVGLSTFKIIAKDKTTNQIVEKTLTNTFNLKNNINVNSFKLDSTNGDFVPTNLTLSWNVTDSLNNINCSLDVNGINSKVNCIGNKVLNNFNKVGLSTFKIVATDKNSKQSVNKTITKTFNLKNSISVNSFKLDSTNGDFVPTNLTLSWNVTDALNDINCTLDVNGVNSSVSCIGNKVMNNFNKTGSSTFKIIATDKNTKQSIEKVISKTFYPNKAKLNANNLQLVVDPVLKPGKFNFKLETTNELIANRLLMVKPVINCGFDNEIKYNSGFLPVFGISKSINNLNVFDFTADTRDYYGNVPLDTSCKLKVYVQDEFGFGATLSKNVKFVYPVAKTTFKSISGRGTDIMNYMNAALLSGFSKGYNTLRFNVVNNENDEKDLSISVISQQIGLNIHEEYTLEPGEVKTLSIPVLISDKTKKGMYPIRYSIRDGKNKLTKYSYILVK